MTDPERGEEPRPDRLPRIRRDWLPVDRWQLPLVYAAAEDIAWLVAEVERLRRVSPSQEAGTP